jgi:drug/metabolite transporter (DMT)-like permease
MTAATYALVVLSAAAHAYWNFLLKRAGGSQAFTGLSKVSEAVMLLPLVFLADPGPAALLSAWALPLVGAGLALLNYLLLTAAYRSGALSIAYPVSRGAILVFLAPLAYLINGETLNAAGAGAVGLVLLGIALIPLNGLSGSQLRAFSRAAATPTTVYALLAAFVAACYTIWDQRAVRQLTPLGYFAAYTVVTGAVFGAILRSTDSVAALGQLWRRQRVPILQVAVLNSGSYLLALMALQTGKASYVIALRQLSIAGGAILGAWLLGEALPASRRAGIALVVAGCGLLALAR